MIIPTSGSDKHSNLQNSRGNTRVSLPERVAQWYYKHGLFLSSYPACATSIAIIVVLLSCYPLLYIPLPGTIPTRVILPHTLMGSDNMDSAKLIKKNYSLVNNILNMDNMSWHPPFPWAQSSSYLFVQQILLRSIVEPWTNDLRLMDAFRGPIYEIFKLLEIVRNHEDFENKRTLDNICLHVENVKRKPQQEIFPEYNCLILSAANFWKQDVHNFNRDPDILNTIFQYHSLQKTKISAAEMLLGLPMQDTGIKRYPIRTRPRVIQHAITLILQKNSPEYLNSLRQKLHSMYPLHQALNSGENRQSFIMYIYYPSEFKLMELLPLVTAFILLFIYIYFSVRKIEIVKSRIVLALCAVFTVLGSLMMSLGLCFFFGLTVSLQSKDNIFPYLVILVGLENCLVITKSVVTTDEAFDVKIRIAQGLSKEGWPISKTLLTEITILTVGLATFVPVIQEFCVFAIVGLISDFFLQMLLFSTVLSLDIKRMDYTVGSKQLPKIHSIIKKERFMRGKEKILSKNVTHSFGMHRSQSHPKLLAYETCTSNSETVQTNANVDKKLPKRLRLVNFWARTRFFQRAFMIWMIVWICSIVYSSGYLQKFLIIDKHSNYSDDGKVSSSSKNKRNNDTIVFEIHKTNVEDKLINKNVNRTVDFSRIQYPKYEASFYLSNFHWSDVLKQYNISLSGKYVTVLPTIKLSYAIKPEMAILLRHPQERAIQNFQWKALAAALDPLDFNDEENRVSIDIPPGGSPLYPKSPMEILLAAILCAISVFAVIYFLVGFYRCVCSKNYAEWRSSWNDSQSVYKKAQEVIDCVPVNIRAHRHQIECLVSDGIVIVTSCLEGEVKVWDSKSGELLSHINRSIAFTNINLSLTDNSRDQNIFKKNTPPIWCIDYFDNLVALGCANGRVEFWETTTGNLKCIYEDDKQLANGITNIHLGGDRVVAARLCGRLDFYKLETYYKGQQIDWGFTSAYRRTHVRTGSTGSISMFSQQEQMKQEATREEMKCTLEFSRIAHKQPITCMEVVNGIILTGSLDHTLKVYSLQDSNLEYALHGHWGPITSIFIDEWQPGTGGSGSQDGMLCVWDLYTRACMYNIHAHDGSVTSLACAPSYVISLGTDERLCIWERFQGNLLNTVSVPHIYSSLLVLTPSLLVTSKIGYLIVWDLRTGEPTKEIKLDSIYSQMCPKIMTLSGNSLVCDYGNRLCIVQFPLIANKND